MVTPPHTAVFASPLKSTLTAHQLRRLWQMTQTTGELRMRESRDKALVRLPGSTESPVLLNIWRQMLARAPIFFEPMAANLAGHVSPFSFADHNVFDFSTRVAGLGNTDTDTGASACSGAYPACDA